MCAFQIVGCSDSRAVNYVEAAQLDSGTCSILGCTDPTATNYDLAATVDVGCTYPIPVRLSALC